MDCSIGQEVQNPTTHPSREAKVMEGGDQVVLVHVVEEPLDVAKEGGTMEITMVCHLNLM